MIGEEEITLKMDKKNGRTSSVPPKSAGGTDSKKTENGNGTKYSHFNKKRESSGRQRLENVSGRRPAPQKCRTSTDKRPRPRGVFNDRQRDEVAEDGGAEYGSAVQQGSRKGNLNHLLNFTYTPREAYRGVAGHFHAGYGGHNRGPWRGFKPKYNKEQFLQANCQFIVRAGEDYFVHCADPDKLVDWDLIEQVRVSSSELPSCPICLYPPVAAKITRCGHIYCWSCLLHYLALGEKNWRKCPICYEAIHKEHLKSVQTKYVPRYKTGDEITLHLMKKERGSTLALPKPYWTQRKGKPVAVDDELSSGSMNIIVASLAQVEKLIIEPEKSALECQLAGETEASEFCFIESALARLQERLIQLKGEKSKEEAINLMEQMQIAVEPSTELVKEPISRTKLSNKPIVCYSSAFSDEEEEPDTEEFSPGEINVQEGMEGGSGPETEVSDENGNPSPPADSDVMFELSPVAAQSMTSPLEIPSEFEEMMPLPNVMPVEEAVEYLEMPRESEEISTKQQSSGSKSFFYFYQAHDGQHIYMHAVNVRCLVREYGSLENCPETITANVVEIESVFMTEDLRRRLRYLSHLPLTCEFQVVELMLKPPIVSKDTLNFFAVEIERRQRLRQRKVRDDKRRERKILTQENEKQGIFPELRIPLNSRSQFPITLPGMEQGVGGSDSPSTVSSPSMGTPVSSPTSSTGLNVFASEFVPGSVAATSPPSTGRWGSDSGGMSFAKMLKEGKASDARVWPKAGKTEMNSGRTPGAEKIGRRHPDSEDSDPEDKVPVPEFHSAFENAIQQAFDNMYKEKVPGNDVEISADVSCPVTIKKKKKQKTLLFTTSMSRGK